MRAIATAAIAIVSLLPSLAFAGNKLSVEDRIELTRGLMAEYGTVKVLLPRSRKPLEFDAKTGYDKNLWAEIAKESGPAARTGDQVQITKIDLEDTKIVLQINGGFKGGRKWYDNVQVGMGGGTAPSPAATAPTRPAAHRLRSSFTSPWSRSKRRRSRRCWRR